MLKCDFCGQETDFVSRVALDKDYDRLTVKHVKRYACKACAEKKEKERVERLKAEKEKKGA
ncbi:MAG: hypothetical protein HY891_00065 [Deltaproteobacteria bacterium]|nr:hypothetical protein [Deltaproteobacteria bacterium]